MLYDRVYMKSPRNIFNRSFCDQLIVILVSSFLLQTLLGLIFGFSVINKTLAFGVSNLSDFYLWTVFTYGFVHDGPLHLIVNLLGIHFIGRPVEDSLGSHRFKIFCLFSLLFGLIAWIPFNYSPQNYIVGASSVVLATLCFFCLSRPNQPITLLILFILPVTIKPKWVLWGTLGLELYSFLMFEIKGSGAIAHSAHLGGMFFGLVFYLHYIEKLKIPIRFKFTFLAKPTLPGMPENKASRYRVNFGSSDSIKAETDRILDKINAKGFGSLSQQEKETLEKAKKLLGK